jgi:hypothetical protein
MGRGFRSFAFIVAALCASAGSHAMTSPGSQAGSCRVAAGEQLLPEGVGGPDICRAIGEAVAKSAPAKRYSVDVSVLSRSRLSARLTVDGRLLPDQNFAVMDRELNLASITRFAESLAREVAKAAKP